MTRALGLDLGSRRIGVAISDSDRIVATPLTTIERDRSDAHRRSVATLVDEWEAGVVVVGLPLSLSGAAGPAAEAATAEIEALRGVLTVPVDTVDERFTTVTAHERLQAAGLSGRARATVVDQTAAAILLQAWLDRDRNG